MDRFAAMTAFVTVAELRGFASAARCLRLSPPAITRLVAALEEQLSIRLLQRTTRSVTLTDAGVRYLERARGILADVDEAERTARAERTEPTGRLVVTAPSVFGRREVLPLVCDFLMGHPTVTGELMLADRMVNLVEEGVDIAVRIGALRDSSLRVRTVGATRRVVVGSPTYLDKKRRLCSPDDLKAHSLIHFTSLSPTPEWRFCREGEEMRVSIAPKFVTNSADAAMGYAERGGGLAMVLAYQVKDLVKTGRLEIVLAKYEPPPLPIQLVYSGTRLPSASVRVFVDMSVSTRNWNFIEL